MISERTKRCPACDETKPLSAYYHTKRTGKPYSWCKKCYLQKQRAKEQRAPGPKPGPKMALDRTRPIDWLIERAGGVSALGGLLGVHYSTICGVRQSKTGWLAPQHARIAQKHFGLSPGRVLWLLTGDDWLLL